MFCPKCSQEQVAEAPKFCSRCGFQLTEMSSLLARGGAPAETQEIKPPRDNVRQCGLRLLMATAVFLVLALFSARAEGDASVSVFGFLAFASFVIGSSVLISSWVKGRRRHRSESVPPDRQTSRMYSPQRGALPSAYAPNVDMPNGRFDTGELAQPPSVTENTTRQLKH